MDVHWIHRNHGDFVLEINGEDVKYNIMQGNKLMKDENLEIRKVFNAAEDGCLSA